MDGWMDGWPRVVKHTHLCFSLFKKKKERKKSEPSSTAEQKTHHTYLPDASNPARTRRLILLLSSNWEVVGGFFVWFSLLEWIWHSPHHDGVFFFQSHSCVSDVHFLLPISPLLSIPAAAAAAAAPTGSVIVKTGGEDKTWSIIHPLTAIKRLKEAHNGGGNQIWQVVLL